VQELLVAYKRPAISPQVEDRLRAIVAEHAKRAGMTHLPGI
jgi:hypothetical protein